MGSYATLERRKLRERYTDGRLLHELESRKGAYYIDYEDMCPLTHTSHRVGRNYKLCSPIVPQNPNPAYCTSGCTKCSPHFKCSACREKGQCASQGECLNRRRDFRRPNQGYYSLEYKRPGTTSPYDPSHYTFHL